MRIEFNEEERNYIVDNPETDLLLTEVGMTLVDKFSSTGVVISLEATETKVQEFLDALREEFVRKINRVAEPAILRGLARRLLPDYDSITLLPGYSLFGG